MASAEAGSTPTPLRRRLTPRSVLFFTVLLVAFLSFLLLLVRIQTTHHVGGGFIGPVRNKDVIVEGHILGDNGLDPHIPPGMAFVAPPKFTEQQLLEKHQYDDLIYTWVDGNNFISRLNKFMMWNQGREVDKRKFTTWVASVKYLPMLMDNSGANQRDRDSGELKSSFRGREEHMKWHRGRVVIVSPGETPSWMDTMKIFRSQRQDWTPTIFQKRRHENATKTQFVQSFVNKLRVVGKQRRPPKRIVIMHQDVIIPEGDSRETFNSNTIEANVWRIPHLTDLFYQFNDDYMIGKKTKVGDFVSRLGGPIIRYENNLMNGGYREKENLMKQKGANSWLIGVYNTNGKIRDLIENEKGGMHWDDSVFSALGKAKDNTTEVEHAPRFFVKHAPFVYCKKVLEYIYHSLETDIETANKYNKARSPSDIYIPFVHHAVALETPWRGAEIFRGGIERGGNGKWPGQKGYENMMKSKHNIHKHHVEGELGLISLDPSVSCGPGFALVGDPLRNRDGQLYFIKDSLKENDFAFNNIKKFPPLFYTLNDMFNKKEAGDQLKDFLADRYPNQSEMEITNYALDLHPDRKEEKKFHERWDAVLMDMFFGRSPNVTMHDLPNHQSIDEGSELTDTTPIVITVTDLDYICPCLRSLQFALPIFNGPIHFIALEDGLRGMNVNFNGPWAEDNSVDDVNANLNYHPHKKTDSPAATTGEKIKLTKEEEAELGIFHGHHKGGNDHSLPYRTGHPRATMDTPWGRVSGLEGTIGNWLPPCHLNEDKVSVLIFKQTRRRNQLEAKYAERFFTPKDKDEFNSDIKHDALDYIWVHGVNPVFGQTISVEDFHFRSAAPVNRDGKNDQNNELGIEHLVVGELDTTDSGLGTIECASASVCLMSFKLPYGKYERIV